MFTKAELQQLFVCVCFNLQRIEDLYYQYYEQAREHGLEPHEKKVKDELKHDIGELKTLLEKIKGLKHEMDSRLLYD